MTTPQEPTITEISAKWADLLTQAFTSIIMHEKALKQAQVQIQNMTEAEARLVENIQDLESEIAALNAEIFRIRQDNSGK